ncbi:uncharacterized protein I303_103197 [Kwoniella dejecticola CBS 10117]|uniref:Uncharacterized protein n=1 Tax=Kwoniella dejecticola CBS 10117 TaxID=1296121 RepID=A0A1A6AAU9_9TREE|nr:uncharacterized protein I303_03220 [Kwoniella dejecticola CBS 10117]OBR87196.1 hypothetical protein I303_03220 [Kwoniella dejecticola CBS 10117]
MYFVKFALLAIPFLGLAATKPVPIAVADYPVVMEKRATAVDVVNTLQSAIADPINVLKTPDVSQEDALAALTSIKSAITDATSAIGSATAKRALLADGVGALMRKRDDLSVVGQVLAEVIKDIVEAVEGLADDLKGLPLIGAIIIDIDFGLNTLLLGVELVLAGVVEILRGLLSGVANLLQNLGNGLLAGTCIVHIKAA